MGLLLGLFLVSRSSVDVLASPLWFMYGSVATWVLYTYRNWVGYAGGLNLAVFIMSVIPVVLHRTSSVLGTNGQSMGKVYFTAMLVYCLLGLASVWTVAYAFVWVVLLRINNCVFLIRVFSAPEAYILGSAQICECVSGLPDYGC
jgi:hypothetical protein